MASIQVLLLVLLSAHATIQLCKVNKFKMMGIYGHEPLFLDAKTLEFIYPLDKNESQTITVDEGTEVLISCATDELDSNSALSIDKKTIRATCNSKSQFEAKGTVFQADTVLCISDYMEVATKTEKKCGNDAGIIIDVNYPIDAISQNVTLYEVCFDPKAKIVLYSKFTSPELANSDNDFDIRPGNPPDDAENFYGMNYLDLDLIYGDAKPTINKLLGLPPDSDLYFSRDPPSVVSINLDRLSDNVYFFYRTQQHSTCRHINRVPIWDIIDSRYLSNWDSIRFGLRRFTYINRYELEIYSGTYGVATLPHNQTNEDIELYLSNDDPKTFPLPKLLWRLVYNAKAKSAIVLVSVNNPWVVKSDDKICEDISSQSGWDAFLTWDKTRNDLLYSYACSYEDFKKTVNFVPDLDVTGILNSSQKHGYSLLMITLSAILWRFL